MKRLAIEYGSEYAILHREGGQRRVKKLLQLAIITSEPTASDRIYSYRLVVPGRIQATGLVIYPARHILSAEAREEPDFQYISHSGKDNQFSSLTF